MHVVESNAQQVDTPSRRRQRQLRWSIVFAVASVYVLIAIGASLSAFHLGVKPAADTMARHQARHVAEITFESVYSLMLAGAGRDRLQQAALRLEHTGSGLSINFVRGRHLVEQFGDLRDSWALKQSDATVRRAFDSGLPQIETLDSSLRVAYPALFREQCLACHTKGVVGEVAGVVAMTYPTQSFEDPQRRAIVPLLVFFAAGFPVVMLATYLSTRGAR